MKTLEQIKKITDQTIQKKKEQTEKAKKKATLKEKEDRQKEIKYALEAATEDLPEWIEEAAKKGKHSFEIDLGIYKDGKLPAGNLLEKKYIKKYLKDFNPTFTDEQREAEVYNYDGESIDTRYYTVCCVHFNW